MSNIKTFSVQSGLGQATQDEVLEGVTFSSDNGIKKTGTLSPLASALYVENITISQANWLDETETTALFRYRISNTAILADMSVDVLFRVDDYTDEQPSSLVRATNSGVLGATTADAGYVDIYATTQPGTDLVCDLALTQLKAV